MNANITNNIQITITYYNNNNSIIIIVSVQGCLLDLHVSYFISNLTNILFYIKVENPIYYYIKMIFMITSSFIILSLGGKS
jgi:CTP synthase (UTP-ammonia lyase)